MLLIPKKKKETDSSAFTVDQAEDIHKDVHGIREDTNDINSSLWGFFGTLTKANKKKFLEEKQRHTQVVAQLNKGPKQDSKDKDTKKKWFKIVGIMAKGIGGLFKGVANIVKGLASKATGLIGFLLGIFIILKLGLLKTLVPAALDMLKTLVTGIIELLPDIIKWAWDILKEWVPKLVNAFADAISDALGLSKESKLRKVMPYLVGIGAGLFALFKVASLFGIGGMGGVGKVFGILIKGLRGLIGALAGPLGLVAAIAAVGFGIYEFIKHSEDVSKWAEKNKLEFIKNRADEWTAIKKAQIESEEKVRELNSAEEKKRQADFLKGQMEANKRRTGARKQMGDDLIKMTRLTDDFQREQAEMMDDATHLRVWTGNFWKAVLGIEGDAQKKIEKEQKKFFAKQKAVAKGKKAGEESNKKIEAMEKKRKFASIESQKKYFNVWGMQDKQRQKKQISALKEQQKVANSYWEKLKTGANDVWSKMPSVKDIKNSLSNNSTIQKMEEFFKPFSQRMAEIFGNIGDTFGAIVDHIMWGLAKAKIFGVNVGGAKSYEEYRSRQIIEKVAKSPERKRLVEDYSSAVASGNQARIEAARKGLTTNERELGELLASQKDQWSKTSMSMDKLVAAFEKQGSITATAVHKFFPEMDEQKLRNAYR